MPPGICLMPTKMSLNTVKQPCLSSSSSSPSLPSRCCCGHTQFDDAHQMPTTATQRPHRTPAARVTPHTEDGSRRILDQCGRSLAYFTVTSVNRVKLTYAMRKYACKREACDMRQHQQAQFGCWCREKEEQNKHPTLHRVHPHQTPQWSCCCTSRCTRS
jgi:hypothetical protein